MHIYSIEFVKCKKKICLCNFASSNRPILCTSTALRMVDHNFISSVIYKTVPRKKSIENCEIGSALAMSIRHKNKERIKCDFGMNLGAQEE